MSSEIRNFLRRVEGQYLAPPELLYRFQCMFVWSGAVPPDPIKCVTVLGVSPSPIFVGLLVPMLWGGGLLSRGCILFVFLLSSAPFHTDVEGSTILVHSCSFRATIGLIWVGCTGSSLGVISIVIIIVAGGDASHASFFALLVRVYSHRLKSRLRILFLVQVSWEDNASAKNSFDGLVHLFNGHCVSFGDHPFKRTFGDRRKPMLMVVEVFPLRRKVHVVLSSDDLQLLSQTCVVVHLVTCLCLLESLFGLFHRVLK